MPAHAAEPPSRASRRDGGSSSNGAAARWRDRAVILVVIWALWALLSTFVVQPFAIPSGSMENTLKVSDRVVVEKWSSDVKRGDVVVFEDPGDWMDTPTSSNPIVGAIRSIASFTHLSAKGVHLVKRVVGLPGDHVSCSGPSGKLTVNGVAVDEPYVHSASGPCAEANGRTTFSVTVPAGHLWVMGDHRDGSDDSRYHDAISGGKDGFVPESDVTGRVVGVVWPVTRWAGSPSDEGAFATVPAAR